MHLRIIPRTLPIGGYQSAHGLVSGWGNKVTGHPPGIHKLGRVMHGERPEYTCSRAVLLRKSIIQPFCGSTVMHNCHSAKVDVPLTKHENGYAILVGYAYMNIVAHQFPQVQMAFTDRVCQQEIIVPELGEILDVCV